MLPRGRFGERSRLLALRPPDPPPEERAALMLRRLVAAATPSRSTKPSVPDGPQDRVGESCWCLPTDICGNLGGFHPPYSEAGSLAALDDAGSTRDQSDGASRGQKTRK